MSSFFDAFRRPGATKRPPSSTPTIRREIQKAVPKPQSAAANGVKRSAAPEKSPKPPTNGRTTKAPAHKTEKPRPVAKSRPEAVRQAQKRRSASPSFKPFGSSSEGDSDDDFVLDHARKKVKTSTTPLVDPKRTVRDVKNWSTDGTTSFPLMHSVNLTTSEFAPNYTAAFQYAGDSIEVELQYTSPSQPERFQLVRHKASDEYEPLADIRQSVIHMLQFYLPEARSSALLDESTGIPFRLSRAANHMNLDSYRKVIADFNSEILSALKEGVIASVLDSKISPLPLSLVEHILNQVYQHTVSPRVKSLGKYKAGSDNVYGELLAPFSSQIFRDARLTSDCVFLDLGSGVGNVVLQAALEIGCESWGIEMMENPCQLAAAQAAEFPARARLWGLDVGKVQLLQGDFREDERVREVLRRADVVLVNNQAFTPDLNSRLSEMFLDLKDGARVVSLKSFVPSGFKLTERTVGSVVASLDVKKLQFWNRWVSWKDDGGDYYVATKDEGRVARFLKAAK